jgi:hypothetical protein
VSYASPEARYDGEFCWCRCGRPWSLEIGFANNLISGGALGWKKRGELELPFETVAFELEASTTASPKYAEAKTVHGYHIIMVEGRK